jgi:hypothetical protein
MINPGEKVAHLKFLMLKTKWTVRHRNQNYGSTNYITRT